MKQLSLTFAPRYPDAPGYKAEGTSRDAAQAVAPRVKESSLAVLNELRKAAGTADEIAKRMKRSPLYIRPRLSELAHPDINLIEKTGERRPNESGLPASVWRVK